MLRTLFTDHPNSVNETYVEHMGMAFGFACRLLAVGMACLIHAVLPFLFVKTGSAMIARLHDEMVANRVRRTAPRGVAEIQQRS